jgi:enamine deaminase RidA (YjgF/YER057c/UK114 family)
MAGKQIIDPGWGYEREFGYSQGVRAGNLVIFAGQMPVDAQCNLVGEGDPAAQIRQVFENIGAVLKAAGLTFDDLVEIVSYHTNMEDLHAAVEIKSEYIRQDFPAWTAVGVTALAFPGQRIEIKPTALARS